MKMCEKFKKNCIRKWSELQSEFLLYDFRQIGFSRYSMQLFLSLSRFQIKVSTNVLCDFKLFQCFTFTVCLDKKTASNDTILVPRNKNSRNVCYHDYTHNRSIILK